MTEQTENYIILKPIAERFNEIAKSFSDEEIRSIIKETMREQISKAFDFDRVQDIVDEYIDNHSDDIADMVKDSISKRMAMTTSRY